MLPFLEKITLKPYSSFITSPSITILYFYKFYKVFYISKTSKFKSGEYPFWRYDSLWNNIYTLLVFSNIFVNYYYPAILPVVDFTI
jgi:hypothetical protein